MDASVGAIVVAALATLLGAVIQGGIGFGMNLVTVPALALVLPEALPVAVIVLGLPISVAMLRFERHAVDPAGIRWILAGRVPGTVLGAVVVSLVSTRVLQGLVGVVVLLLLGASLVIPPVRITPGSQLTAGAVSGLTGTAAGIGGPPLALLYQHRSGPTIRSTLAASFLFGTVLSLTVLAVAGEVGGDQLVLGVALTPLVVGGSVVGRRLHAWLEQGWLRPTLLTFVAATAVVAILDAIL